MLLVLRQRLRQLSDLGAWLRCVGLGQRARRRQAGGARSVAHVHRRQRLVLLVVLVLLVLLLVVLVLLVLLVGAS